MSLRFLDSVQHYATADIATKWPLASNSPTVTASVGRWGGQGLVLGDIDFVGRAFDSQATWIVGVAFYMNTLPQSTAQPFIQFRDNTTVHTELRMRSDGRLETFRNGTSMGGLSTTTLVAGNWYYVEALTTIHDSAGVFQVRINNVMEINQSSVDTRNGANSSADTIIIRGTVGGSNFNWTMSDLYICDAQGSTNNTFLGDLRVDCLKPNGNGNSSVLVGSDGNSTDNYLLVDETTPNGDTDYVESSTVGDKDTYTFTDLVSTSGTVLGLMILPYAKKTDAGTRSIVSVARLSSTEVDSADKALGTSYTYLPDVRETKPGGGAWSITDVNGAEFGVKVTA